MKVRRDKDNHVNSNAVVTEFEKDNRDKKVVGRGYC